MKILSRYTYFFLFFLLVNSSWLPAQELLEFIESMADSDSKEILTKIKYSYGIELEGVVDKKIGLQGTTDAVEKLLQKTLPGIKITRSKRVFYTNSGEARYSIDLKYTYKKEQYTWEIKEDGSIKPKKNEIGIELASPILRNQADLGLLDKVMVELARIGVKTELSSAGVHVNQGFLNVDWRQNPTLARKIALATIIFNQIDLSLKKLWRVNPKRYKWAKSLPLKVIDGLYDIQDGAELERFIKNVFPDKYRAFNLKSLLKHGTLESRMFNSSFDPKEIRWSRVMVNTVFQAVVSNDPKLMQFAVRPDKGPQKTYDVLNSLGVPFPKFIGCGLVFGGFR